LLGFRNIFNFFYKQKKLRKGTFEYLENLREIKTLDKQIESGSFAMVLLIIDNRLFVANVGTSHCFICVHDKVTNEKKVISLVELEHSITNLKEMIRLSNLMANIQSETEKSNDASFEANKSQVKYTRCLGDFKLKLYYHEYPQFK
jgi:TAK1-binding protein 1